MLVPLVVVLIAAIAGGVWWLGRDTGTTPTADTKPKPHHSQSQKGNGKPTKKPSSTTPSPTKPTKSQTPKPDVVLKSEFAFPKNSAALSGAAKHAIAHLAGEIKAAHLHGTVIIDGYTDNLGSAASGLALSQRRADTVAGYLRWQAASYHLTILANGHGEANPVASNATEKGRQKNRRVTITLPKGSQPPQLSPHEQADMSRPVLRVGFVTGATPDKWAATWRERYPTGAARAACPSPRTTRSGCCATGRWTSPWCGCRSTRRRPARPSSLYDEVPVVVTAREHFVAAADEVVLADLVDEQAVPAARGPAGLSGWSSSPGRPCRSATRSRPSPPAPAWSSSRCRWRACTTARTWCTVPSPTWGRPPSRLPGWSSATTSAPQRFVGVVRGRSARSSR